VRVRLQALNVVPMRPLMRIAGRRPPARSATRGKGKGPKCENVSQARCLTIEATIQLGALTGGGLSSEAFSRTPHK